MTGAPCHVVIIDDSRDDRAEVRRLLLRGSDRRYRFTEAETGVSGMRAVLDRSPASAACVVLDYDLPDMNAVEVIRSIRGDDGQPLCPVVVLTGSASSELGLAALRAGAQDFLGKSWMTPESLTRAVENAAERWEMARELRAREQELALALDAAGMFYFSWDIRTDRVSRRLSQDPALPSTSEEVPGPVTFGQVLSVVHPEDRAAFEATVRAALGGDGRYASAYRVLRPDGSVAWLEEHGRVEFDAAGQPLRLSGVTRDVTAREQEAERRAVLLKVARLILEAPVADAALTERVFSLIRGPLQADVLFHYRHDAEALHLVAGAGIPAELAGAARRLALGEAFCGTAAASRETLIADAHRIAADPAGSFVHQLAVRAYVCHPLLGRGGELLGTFSVASRGRDTFTPPEVQLLQTVSHFLALAWERQRGEDALRASEAALARKEREFRSLADNSPDILTRIDRDLRHRFINAAIERACGRPRADFLGRTNRELGMPEDLCARWESAMRGVFETGAPTTIEFDFPTPAGRRRFSSHIVPEPDLEGHVAHLLCVARDVTEAQEAEAAIRSSEERLRMALSAAQAGAWAWDVGGSTINWSPENFELFGFDPSDGAPSYTEWAPRLPREDRERIDQLVQDSLSGRSSSFRAEFRVLHPALGTRWLLGLGKVERAASGEPLRMVGINIDITDRKRLEAVLLQADRNKDEFLAMLAHELRNPLAPLRNGLELLHHCRENEEIARKAKEMMGRQLSHLLRLVDDLLDVSRIGSGKIELRRERIPIRAVLDHALEASRPLAEARGHELLLLAEDDPLYVDGDLTRLAQVVGNLLNNAAKYTPRGGRIELRARGEGPEIVVSVADNGTGIAPDMLARVFELFTQVDRTIDRAQGGLGIGLSLVRSLVELHGGSISAQSAGLDRGSTFTVRLPRAAPPEAAATVAIQPAERDERPASRRLLIVDDNVDAAESLSMVLEMLGHEVRSVHDGLSALEAARAMGPDIVILDIGMPGMSGYDVARRLRDDAATARAVLVALTGWGTAEERSRTREAGFDLHLTKPVDIATLQRLLDSLPRG